MSDTVIKVENLSKRYVIGHQRQERYSTLRDAIASGARSLKQKIFNFNQNFEDPAHEDFWALKDVSFEIKQGDRVGIIGRNGAGKSTLLKILSRITEPTSGKISIRGRVASLLEVGTGFHNELTGRENIFLNGAILGMSRAEINKKFDEIVSFAEIEKFLDTPVKHYSSGMYVRLAFAVAAHLEPEILIVDEVLAVGDAAFQKKCLGKMEDVAENDGRTVLFVSHNMLAIKSLCNRSILMESGEINVDSLTPIAVAKYLHSSFSKNFSQKIWNKENRPRNHSMAINSIKLKNSQKEESLKINISEEAYIEIEYEVIQPNSKVSFSIDLFNSENHCVFSSLSNLESFFYGKCLQRGTYLTRCTLYGNLLNSGSFTIIVNGFSANWTDKININDSLCFEMIDDGVLKSDYFGTYAGDTRPKLLWTTSYMAS